MEKPLPVPEIPALITDPFEKVEYATRHFWEGLPPGDSININLFEQDLANFAAIAANASGDAQLSAWRVLWQKRPGCFEAISPILEDYLWEGGSPVYSPDLFARAIDMADSLGMVGQNDRLRLIRDEIRQNAPGSRVADFSYIDRNGNRHTITDNKKLRLVIFYDPECEHCASEMTMLAQNGDINEAISDGSLEIVAIYPGGDFELWMTQTVNLPDTWTVGMNRERPIGTLDDWSINTTPLFYMIDRDGIVKWRGKSVNEFTFQYFNALSR